jgi:hypothetical protein
MKPINGKRNGLQPDAITLPKLLQGADYLGHELPA